MNYFTHLDSNVNNRELLKSIGVPKSVVEFMPDLEVFSELKSFGYDWVKKSFGNFTSSKKVEMYESY